MIEISLEAARKNAKFTKSQWANELRTKSSTVTKWEKGEAEPTLTQLRRMSELSGIPVDYLFVPDCSGQERGMTAIEKEERAGLQEELIEIILETKGMPVLQFKCIKRIWEQSRKLRSSVFGRQYSFTGKFP